MSCGLGGTYFVSDVHLGAAFGASAVRERRFVSFLDSLPDNTTDLYLLGDVFDFWVEYRDVVPRGFIRALGALAALSDRGVKLHFARGNHDWWVTDYLEKELGMEILEGRTTIRRIEGFDVCMGHGDALGKVDFGSKFIFHLFRSTLCIKLLRMLHPYLIFDFASRWSRRSRVKHSGYEFRGSDEPLCGYLESECAKSHFDIAVFGHLHTPVVWPLKCGAVLYVLGDWSSGVSYLNLSGMNISGLGLPNIEK